MMNVLLKIHIIPIKACNEPHCTNSDPCLKMMNSFLKIHIIPIKACNEPHCTNSDPCFKIIYVPSKLQKNLYL